MKKMKESAPLKCCCVPSCPSSSSVKPVKNVDFYPFPKKKKFREEWIAALKDMDMYDKIVGTGGIAKLDSSFLCSRHFSKDDFQQDSVLDSIGKRRASLSCSDREQHRSLKIGAVPSVFVVMRRSNSAKLKGDKVNPVQNGMETKQSNMNKKEPESKASPARPSRSTRASLKPSGTPEVTPELRNFAAVAQCMKNAVTSFKKAMKKHDEEQSSKDPLAPTEVVPLPPVPNPVLDIKSITKKEPLKQSKSPNRRRAPPLKKTIHNISTITNRKTKSLTSSSSNASNAEVLRITRMVARISSEVVSSKISPPNTPSSIKAKQTPNTVDPALNSKKVLRKSTLIQTLASQSALPSTMRLSVRKSEPVQLPSRLRSRSESVASSKVVKPEQNRKSSASTGNAKKTGANSALLVNKPVFGKNASKARIEIKSPPKVHLPMKRSAPVKVYPSAKRKKVTTVTRSRLAIQPPVTYKKKSIKQKQSLKISKNAHRNLTKGNIRKWNKIPMNSMQPKLPIRLRSASLDGEGKTEEQRKEVTNVQNMFSHAIFKVFSDAAADTIKNLNDGSIRSIDNPSPPWNVGDEDDDEDEGLAGKYEFGPYGFSNRRVNSRYHDLDTNADSDDESRPGASTDPLGQNGHVKNEVYDTPLLNGFGFDMRMNLEVMDGHEDGPHHPSESNNEDNKGELLITPDGCVGTGGEYASSDVSENADDNYYALIPNVEVNEEDGDDCGFETSEVNIVKSERIGETNSVDDDTQINEEPCSSSTEKVKKEIGVD